MKIKNAFIEQSLEAIAELTKFEMRPSLAWKLRNMAKHLSAQGETYFEMRKELVEKYAVRDENGNIEIAEGTQNVSIPNESIHFFVELAEQEGNDITPLKLSDLDSIEKVPASVIFKLDNLIDSEA